ncbi:MAG: DUF3352 domain-containing protein, partial [Verrucomicrobiota bacterium]|nr:DUF3352 domain-containing protein [Verrucomicrobiota bacterium]
MKKLLAVVLVVLLVAGAVLVFFRVQKKTGGTASSLVGSDAVLFIEAPDIARSREEFKKTALYKIWREPEVQAFVEQPRSKIPPEAKVQERVNRLRALDPREAFAALNSIESPMPVFVAGLRYGGKKEDAEALLRDMKSRLQTLSPSAKADLVNYRGIAIETLTESKYKLAWASHKTWLAMSNDVTALQGVLDRIDNRVSDDTSLAKSDVFKKTIAKIPASREVLIYAQAQKIVERILPILTATGQNLDPSQVEKMKQIKSVTGATTFENEQIRDTMFVLRDGATKMPAMARSALAFTTAESLVYYAGVMQLESFKMPTPALDPSGFFTRIEQLRRSLEEHGITGADFIAAFGPEFSAIVDWPPTSRQPSLLLTLDVKDRARAQKLADYLTSGEEGLPMWANQEIAGARFYALAAGNVAIVTPAFAITDKFLIFGLDFEALKTAIEQSKTASKHLDSKPDYSSATTTVGAPTRAHGFIDSRNLFDRIYGTLRPFAIMWSAFAPKVNEFVDINKLPATETISKHLGPIVYSQSESDEGDLVESVGTVTFAQAAFGFGIGAGVALAPTM